MRVEFFKTDKFIDDCEQSNIPRSGDYVIISGLQYTVLSVIWNYDNRIIRIQLAGGHD